MSGRDDPVCWSRWDWWGWCCSVTAQYFAAKASGGFRHPAAAGALMAHIAAACTYAHIG